MGSYDVFYHLPVAYEDLKRGGPGWYKLSWRPIFKETYSVYVEKTVRPWSCYFIGLRFYWNHAHNGWGRSWDGFCAELGLAAITIHVWMRWNFLCMAEGPSDEKPPRPLDLSRLAAKRKMRWFGLLRPTTVCQNVKDKG